MKNSIKKKKLFFFSKEISNDFFIKITIRKILLPFYHTISDVRLAHISNLYPIRNKEFLLKEKYFPFSDDEIKIELFNYLYNVENCKISFGISGIKDDFSKFNLHRIPMENNNKSAEELIKFEYFYFKIFFEKIKLKENDFKRFV